MVKIKQLYCFDMDGTLECKEQDSEYINGPIKLAVLRDLEEVAEICIVSPSPYYPKNKDGSPRYPLVNKWGSDSMRSQNLADASDFFKEKHGSFPLFCFYVSNNGDKAEAKKANFVYIDAQAFADGNQ